MNEPSLAEADGRQTWRFSLFLGLLIAGAFGNVLLGFDTFVVRDFGIFSFPNASFQRECFWHGQLPFWNPYNCCGLPFLAQFNTLALYPLALVYLLLPLTWALPLFCLLHLFIGGVGMYRLACRWTGSSAGAMVAGVVFAFNGLSLNFLMWPSHVATFAWLPWVILLTEAAWQRGGRAIVPAALAGAMQILGGGPETILFTWLILGALFLLEGRAGKILVLTRRFAAVAGLALGLSAMQLLPFIDFALHCSRNTNYAASEWSMPAGGLANFLAPLYHTDQWQGLAMQQDQYWTSSYYVGIGTIFFALLALWRARQARVWLLAGCVTLSLVLALGDHGGLYGWLRHTFPFFGYFRFPIKFVIISSALFPLLAAFAFGKYEGAERKNWLAEGVCLGGIIALTLVIAAGSGFVAKESSRIAWLLVISAAVYLYAGFPSQRRWNIWLVPLICALDLFTAVPWQNPTLNPSVYQVGLGQMTDQLNPPPRLGDSRLMLSSFSARQNYYHPPQDLKTAYLLDRATFLGDCNLLDNLPKVDGFYSVYLRDTDKILWLLDDATGERLDRLEDLLGISQTVAPGKVYDWMPRNSYLPVISAGQEPVFADEPATLAAIKRGAIDVHYQVLLPPEAQGTITARRVSSARVVRQDFGLNKVSITVDTPAAAMVVISQSYYHNWKARVDGNPARLWRANYAFQAVEIPAGRHELVLVYRDMAFFIGLAATVLAGMICVFLRRQR